MKIPSIGGVPHGLNTELARMLGAIKERLEILFGERGDLGSVLDLIIPELLFGLAISEETTAILAGASKITFHAPYDFTLQDVIAGLSTVSSSGSVIADINRNGTSIFSVAPTIPANAEVSTTYSFASNAKSVTFTKRDKITIDIDSAGTGAAGLKVYFLGHRGRAR